MLITSQGGRNLPFFLSDRPWRLVRTEITKGSHPEDSLTHKQLGLMSHPYVEWSHVPITYHMCTEYLSCPLLEIEIFHRTTPYHHFQTKGEATHSRELNALVRQNILNSGSSGEILALFLRAGCNPLMCAQPI
jgi:hypothetical protein